MPFHEFRLLKEKSLVEAGFGGIRDCLLVLSASGNANSIEILQIKKGKNIHGKDNRKYKLIFLNHAAPNLLLRQGNASAFLGCFMTPRMERVSHDPMVNSFPGISVV